MEGVDLAGRQALILAADGDRLASPPAASGVRLLGGYDAYLDQRDRETLLPDRDLRKRVRRPLGNPGVVLVDGQLAALWRPEKKGKRLVGKMRISWSLLTSGTFGGYSILTCRGDGNFSLKPQK